MSAHAIELATSGLVAPHLFGHRVSGGRFKIWPHVCHLGQAITQTVGPGNGKLLVNMPPRFGKSELLSLWTPAWFLALDPSKRVIVACNKNDLAASYGQKVRDVIRANPWLGFTVTGDTSAKDNWATDKGGGLIAVGVGESVLGRGADLFIVDDPYKTWADAQSPTTRGAIYDWFQGTATNRLEPGASMLVLHHRMHIHDLSHSILTGEDGSEWKHICLPALAGPNDPLGRAPGESLCPDRYSADQINDRKRRMGSKFDPMFQQDCSKGGAGTAYNHFGLHNQDPAVEFNPALPLDVSVDFNIDPGMHIMLGQHDRASDVAYCFDEIHGPRMNVGEACKELGRRVAKFPSRPAEIRVFGDATGTAKNASTGTSHYDALFRGLNELGITLRDRVPKANPPVVDRLNTFNYALRDVDDKIWYKVHPRCERLIRDLVGVMKDDKGGIDKTTPDLTHASDCEGYRLHEIRGFRPAIKQPKGQFHY